MRDDEYGDEYEHSLNVASWYAGQVFEKGQIIYYEGDKGGQSTGVHVHVRLGKGNFISPWRSIPDPKDNVILNTSSTTPLKHDQVFFTDQVNISYGACASASKFNWRTTSDNNTTDPTDPTDPVTSTSVYLQGVLGGFNIRETAGSGTVKKFVSAGENAEILEFVPGFIVASDGKSYQWARVNYNGQVGFVQIDTVGFNQLEF